MEVPGSGIDAKSERSEEALDSFSQCPQTGRVETPDRQAPGDNSEPSDRTKLSPPSEELGIAEKRVTLFVLGLDVMLFAVFYMVFFPKAITVQVSTALGLATGLLGLLGFKANERTFTASLLTKTTLTIAKRAALVFSIFLVVGLARPFRVRTLPGASVYVDDKLNKIIARDAAIDESGLATTLIYDSWEPHDFAAEKHYFLTENGEKRASRRTSWLRLQLSPGVDLPLRACLGQEEPAATVGDEWTFPDDTFDFNKEPDIGDAAFETTLRAIDYLAGAGYPPKWSRISIAVQCGSSVKLSHVPAVNNPFSPGSYLGVLIDKTVQLRIPLDKTLPLPDRVIIPATDFGSKLLDALQIRDTETLEKLRTAIKEEAAPVLRKEAEDKSQASDQDVLSKLGDLNWLKIVVPFNTDSLGYACLTRNPKATDASEIKKLAADLPVYEKLALRAHETTAGTFAGGTVANSFQILALAAQATQQRPLYAAFYGSLKNISDHAEDDQVRAHAVAALKQVASPFDRPKPCPLHGRVGRNPQTGEAIMIPGRER
jgi:hypothetical protein